jgi:antitoxin VapB
MRTTLFMSNRSQAVRIPKDLAFGEGIKHVVVRKVGAQRIICPADAAWDDFFDEEGVDLGTRDQPKLQVREAF